MVAPTGEQFEIEAAGYTATITEAGASLRALAKDGRRVIDGFAEDTMPSACRGQLLMPWPNRIRDGRYTFEGASQQLPLSEPARHNASHGLARWSAWRVLARTSSRIELGLRLPAQTGYPWILDLGAVYELGEDGLTVTQSATNRSTSDAPYASGAHPYLTLDTGSTVDPWTLHAPAATRLESDPERKLPVGRSAVAGTAYDFRQPRVIGETSLDDCFTDLVRAADGSATVTLSTTAPDGGERVVELWLDEHHRWLMLYTADDRTPPRASIAIEPMTAPVDAFNSGEDLVVLAPGETFSARWALRAH
ncbi:aldose 1-epimerase family protein [Nocardioides sp. BP30]|uniref:aldose 1-epimerase family protein n=1 Tax=Nocardioides sp. BP30 TaxID=3036374 RepID=UPI0024684A6D|nr:aldose 1-epimerase family protein [Nocardioides sp. BP30]WGL50489.1 aldose 1-epimerase family protein [Nocardioides sp. BP30]